MQVENIANLSNWSGLEFSYFLSRLHAFLGVHDLLAFDKKHFGLVQLLATTYMQKAEVTYSL